MDGTPSTTGQLTYTDVDNNSSATWSGDANGTYGTFSITGSGAWTYTINQEAADEIDEGDTLTETFTATVTDDKGSTAQQLITVTITGTNDSPIIQSGGDIAGSITEASGLLKETGSITFSDVDLGDNEGNTAITSETLLSIESAVNLTAEQEAAIENAFTIAENNFTNSGGTINWTYEINGSEISYLGLNETVKAIFTVVVTDQKGAAASENVTITLTELQIMLLQSLGGPHPYR